MNWIQAATLAALCSLSSTLAARAMYKMGGMDSGGGHAIVCRDNNGAITSVRTYDFVEAEFVYELTLIPPLDASASTLEMTKALIDQLPSFDRTRRERYLLDAEAFLSRDRNHRNFARFLSGTDLPFVDDANAPIIQRGCKLEQLVIQREPEFSGDPAYIVSEDLWNKLSSFGQAGIVMHELIYRQARQLKAENSKKARRFNSLLAANHWEGCKIDDQSCEYDYRHALTELALPAPYAIAMKPGYVLNFNLISTWLWPNGKVKSGTIGDTLLQYGWRASLHRLSSMLELHQKSNNQFRR